MESLAAPTSSPSLAQRLGCLSAASAGETNWHGTAEQAADLARMMMCCTDVPCWQRLPSLLSHIYLFLKNLRADKALGFNLALSHLRSPKLQLQAELATQLVSAVCDQEQLPLRIDLHHHLPPWSFSQVLQSLLLLQDHSLSYEVALHLRPFATMAQLVFLRTPVWKISLPVSQACGIFSSENDLLSSLTSSDIC